MYCTPLHAPEYLRACTVYDKWEWISACRCLLHMSFWKSNSYINIEISQYDIASVHAVRVLPTGKEQQNVYVFAIQRDFVCLPEFVTVFPSYSHAHELYPICRCSERLWLASTTPREFIVLRVNLSRWLYSKLVRFLISYFFSQTTTAANTSTATVLPK